MSDESDDARDFDEGMELQELFRDLDLVPEGDW